MVQSHTAVKKKQRSTDMRGVLWFPEEAGGRTKGGHWGRRDSPSSSAQPKGGGGGAGGGLKGRGKGGREGEVGESN